MILGPLARARFYSVSVHKRAGDVIGGALAQVEKPVPRLFALLRNGAALLRRGATYKGW